MMSLPRVRFYFWALLIHASCEVRDGAEKSIDGAVFVLDIASLNVVEELEFTGGVCNRRIIDKSTNKIILSESVGFEKAPNNCYIVKDVTWLFNYMEPVGTAAYREVPSKTDFELVLEIASPQRFLTLDGEYGYIYVERK